MWLQERFAEDILQVVLLADFLFQMISQRQAIAKILLSI